MKNWMLRRDSAKVTFTSSRGTTSSFGGGRTSLTRVSFPMGISESDFLFIVFRPLSPASRTKNPNFPMTGNASDRHDPFIDFSNTIESRFDHAMLGVNKGLPFGVRERPCSHCEIDAMLFNIYLFLLRVPDKDSKTNIHCLQYISDMANNKYNKPYLPMLRPN